MYYSLNLYTRLSIRMRKRYRPPCRILRRSLQSSQFRTRCIHLYSHFRSLSNNSLRT